jgi:glyoxylase-like metal-dependent hydrolase (beta-lactamase superfamily II)
MIEIAPNIYVSTEYPGVNVGFIAVSGGAIAVDAPTLPGDARAWRKEVVETAGGPILYLVLTDAHPDRLLSAGLLEAPVVAAQGAQDRISAYTDGFWRTVVDAWIRCCPEAGDDLGNVSASVVPEIMFTDRLTLCKGSSGVTVERVDGCSAESAWIHLGEPGVLFAGDTVVVGTHPYLSTVQDSGAWLGKLKTLRRPRFSETAIVPGRGPVSDQSATSPLSDYLALLRRRARSLQRGSGARADRVAAVAELLSQFPVPDDERDIAQRRVRAGLDRVCEEIAE